jgi:hypothetical protein
MKTYAIYTNLTDTVTLACEDCKRAKALRAADLKDLPQPLKFRCPCGASFEVNIVIRQFYRKKTTLSGSYVKRDHQTNKTLEQGRVTIEDLSRTGVGLRTLSKHNVAVDDVLVITFTLDDEQRTRIEKHVRVRRVDTWGVGAEFVDSDAYTEANRILGFYLRPR